MIPLGTIQWLADKILQRGVQKKTEIKEKRDRVASYFDDLAGTLESILSSFRNNEIPRIAGNNLNELLGNFSRVVHSIYIDRDGSDKDEIHRMLSELYQTAERCRNYDMLMIGKGYFGENDPLRVNLLADLERAIGRYRGLASSLRAIALE
jgi:hypothetical protein